MEVEPFQAELIIVQGRLRSELNEKKVKKLMDSIEKIGLTELPCVRYIKDEDGGDRAVLVVGWHRLEALKRLGHEWVECRIFEGSETAARLWEVSENLHRADLTPDDRDKHIREWFNLTGQDHKEEGAQENEPEDGQRDKVTAGGHLARRPGAGPGSVGGVREFARDFNLPLTTVQEALDLGNLDPAAKNQADAAGLNRKEKLKAVRTAGADPEKQTAVVHELAQERAAKETRERKKREQLAENKKRAQKKRSAKPPFVAAPSESQMFGEWLMERMTHNEMPKVISWLEGCKPKDVIAVMRKKAA